VGTGAGTFAGDLCGWDVLAPEPAGADGAWGYLAGPAKRRGRSSSGGGWRQLPGGMQRGQGAVGGQGQGQGQPQAGAWPLQVVEQQQPWWEQEQGAAQGQGQPEQEVELCDTFAQAAGQGAGGAGSSALPASTFAVEAAAAAAQAATAAAEATGGLLGLEALQAQLEADQRAARQATGLHMSRSRAASHGASARRQPATAAQAGSSAGAAGDSLGGREGEQPAVEGGVAQEAPAEMAAVGDLQEQLLLRQQAAAPQPRAAQKRRGGWGRQGGAGRGQRGGRDAGTAAPV
jgi:hypothetical protein